MNVAVKLIGIIAVQIVLLAQALAADRISLDVPGVLLQRDSVVLSEKDSLEIIQNLNNPYRRLGARDTLTINQVEYGPFVSLQQYLKGQTSGMHVLESSGEPGSLQAMYLRGISAPIHSATSSVTLQPQVYLNGIPLTVEHPFAYDIQQYSVNRIGTATNTLAGLNINNIRAIEIVKDPVTLAKLGPLASNGAVFITTENARASSRSIEFNTYAGFVGTPAITPVNAYYENGFRQQFYAKYSTLEDRLKYPTFLSDSTNLNYFGPARWHNTYYKNSPLLSADVSLGGGSPRANFRFYAGHTTNAGNSDDTQLQSYNVAFFVNMAPFKWLNLTSMLTGTLLDRDRNRAFRDRFAEMRYVPNLGTPMPPNENVYQRLIDEYSKSIDDNKNSLVQGNVSLNFDILPTLRYSSRMSFDYNQGVREVFYPSTMMEGNNYISHYFGYSQRIIFNNLVNYDLKLGTNSKLNFEFGNDLLFDTYKYNYSYGYRGHSDFIKVIVVDGNSSSSRYLQPQGMLVFRNTDQQKIVMSSFYGHAKYQYQKLMLNGILRTDGVSNMPPDSRWNISGGVGAAYDLVGGTQNDFLNKLSVNAAWSRVGRTTIDDRYAVGPQYRVDIGWQGAVNMPSFNGFPVISRPYTQGWSGYGISWPYSDKIEIGFASGFLQDRLHLGVQAYQRDDNSQIIQNPIPQEYGYAYELVNGLDVRNRGVDVDFGASLLAPDKAFQWRAAINFGLNNNELKSLPNNTQSIVLGDRLLQVGDRVDRFWLLEGVGVYNTESEIPTLGGSKLSYNGLPFRVGDPKWTDQNKDNIINADDKVLKGQILPKITGGFHNNFSYRNFDLGIDIIFATGHTALNQRASNVYNFINLENNNSINSAKEIFFWQQDVDIAKYPIYNPWSSTDPYQVNQELFLEKLDFLKLRSVTLGYDAADLFNGSRGEGGFNRAYLYVTGANLLTFTRFSGMDPELVNVMGMYDGYGMSVPKTFTLGIKLSF